MAERSKYQNRVIKNFYKNREAISLQRLGELATELYLAEGKKRQQVWQQISSALQHLGIKPARVEHLKSQDNPELIAKLVEELMNKQG